MSLEQPTPRTDALILRNSGFGPTDHQWRQHARALERDCDSAKQLNRELLNKLEAMQDERIATCVNACAGMADPASEIQALRDRAESKHGLWMSELKRVTKLEKELSAMREAIKEAYQILQTVPTEYDPRFFRAGKWTETALAKLQPSIKP